MSEKLNVKRFVIVVIAAYIVMAIIGIVSDMLLADHMTTMKAVQRSMPDLAAHAVWMYLGYLIVTIMFCYIYVQKHEGKGWMEGARFGLWIGIMMAGVTMVIYATMPMDPMESLISAILGIIIYMAGGITTALVYKTEG